MLFDDCTLSVFIQAHTGEKLSSCSLLSAEYRDKTRYFVFGGVAGVLTFPLGQTGVSVFSVGLLTNTKVKKEGQYAKD